MLFRRFLTCPPLRSALLALPSIVPARGSRASHLFLHRSQGSSQSPPSAFPPPHQSFPGEKSGHETALPLRISRAPRELEEELHSSFLLFLIFPSFLYFESVRPPGFLLLLKGMPALRFPLSTALRIFLRFSTPIPASRVMFECVISKDSNQKLMSSFYQVR